MGVYLTAGFSKRIYIDSMDQKLQADSNVLASEVATMKQQFATLKPQLDMLAALQRG